VLGEFVVELGEQCDAVRKAELGVGGGEGGILRRHRAVDDEGRLGQRQAQCRSPSTEVGSRHRLLLLGDPP
jgi:hypothetical protein